MPQRYYICDNCDYKFDIRQGFNEPTLKKCPVCKKHKLYQDLSGMYGFVVQDAKTVGQLAERNRKKMGRYELENRMAEDKIPEQIAAREKRKKVNKLANMNAEQKRKYIMEGE